MVVSSRPACVISIDRWSCQPSPLASSDRRWSFHPDPLASADRRCLLRPDPLASCRSEMVVSSRPACIIRALIVICSHPRCRRCGFQSGRLRPLRAVAAARRSASSASRVTCCRFFDLMGAPRAAKLLNHRGDCARQSHLCSCRSRQGSIPLRLCSRQCSRRSRLCSLQGPLCSRLGTLCCRNLAL